MSSPPRPNPGTRRRARSRRSQPSNPADDERPPAEGEAAVTAWRDGAQAVRFDVTVVDGEAGRRLAALQAEVILDVLTWLHEHRPGTKPD